MLIRRCALLAFALAISGVLIGHSIGPRAHLDAPYRKSERLKGTGLPDLRPAPVGRSAKGQALFVARLQEK